jgi:hypothetical protein
MKFFVQVTTPKKGLIDLGRFNAALEAGLDESAEQVKTNLLKPTATWKTKVAFVIRAIANGREITTNNEIYGYVSGGTRPHTIRAKNAKYLNFSSVHQAKTAPGSLDAGSGARGSNDTFRKAVQHPGSKARKFDKQAAKLARKDFPKRMQQAVKEGVK